LVLCNVASLSLDESCQDGEESGFSELHLDRTRLMIPTWVNECEYLGIVLRGEMESIVLEKEEREETGDLIGWKGNRRFRCCVRRPYRHQVMEATLLLGE